MKKTVSVNIRGINFMIEEDAYELLQDYLDRLSQTLKNEDGSREILEDVELRIAEICTGKLTDNKTVIELSDIEEILAALGDPKDYVEENEEAYEEQNQNYSRQDQKNDRRLFRDTDNATIAGVCSGIANFLNVDVVIIRAIFVVMFLFAGFGFPLYIILWVIVPKAKSSIDRLRMKGRPITVETVREEVENAAENIQKGGKRFAHSIRRDDHNYHRHISRGARIFTTLIGIGFLLVGLTMLVPFLIFIIGGFEFIPIHGDQGFVSFSQFGELVLNSNGDYSTMWAGGILGGFSVILFFLLVGFMLLFRLKNRWTKLSLLGLFLSGLTGFILVSVAGMNTGKDFALKRELVKNVADVKAQEITIIPTLRDLEENSDFKIRRGDGLRFLEIDDDKVIQYGIDFEYIQSDDSLFHITEIVSAHSETRDKGNERCKNVEHKVMMTGDSLFVATDYSYPTADKIRHQEVTMIVAIPKGGTVKFKDHVISLGTYDAEGNLIEPAYKEDGYLKASGKYRHYD